MKSVVTFLKASVVLGFALFLFPSLTLAQHYTQTNLVSNTANAPLHDPIHRMPGRRDSDIRIE